MFSRHVNFEAKIREKLINIFYLVMQQGLCSQELLEQHLDHYSQLVVFPVKKKYSTLCNVYTMQLVLSSVTDPDLGQEGGGGTTQYIINNIIIYNYEEN